MTTREISTILAALRYWQREASWHEIETIATGDGKFEALNSSEIDALCERINCAGRSPTTARAAACHALTHRPGHPGIDWAMLDRHRLKLCSLGEDKKRAVALFEAFSRAEAEAIDGVVNCLDWLCDLAHDAGLFRRKRRR